MLSLRFSIVLQGAWCETAKRNLQHARSFSEDVIFSTWVGMVDDNIRSDLTKLGIKIIETDDPGAPYVAFQQAGSEKNLNVNRQLMGARAGISVALNEIIIRSRIDARLDYHKLLDFWVRSEKKFGAVNVTTVCPDRFLSYPYLFHISDWCHIGHAKDFLNAIENFQVNEGDFQRSDVLRIRDMTWKSTLSAEQIIALVLTKSALLYSKENAIKKGNYSADLLCEHARILSQFCNIDKASVSLRSDKYKLLSTRWQNFDKSNFEDNHLLKPSPVQFFWFFIGRARSYFAAFRMAKK